MSRNTEPPDPGRDQPGDAISEPALPLFALLSVSPRRKAEVLADISQGSLPRPLYYILLLASAGIAAFGLLANSAAVVIGAMLVSPLMAPIFGTALGLSRGDLRLLGQALIAEFGGVALIIGFAFLLGLLPFALEVTPEMVARTRPSLIDLLVATMAGLAGGLAMVDERTSPALPGVAIATSLTPPLATCGLSLAFGAFEGAWGAFLLFFANFLAILAVSTGIFITAGFVTREELGSRTDWLKRFSAAGIGLLAVAAILTRQLVLIIEDWSLRKSITATLQDELADDAGAQLADLVYDKAHGGGLNVLATVRTPRAFSPQDVGVMQQHIADAVGQEVSLFVRCAMTQDVAAAGSANLLPTVDLNGHFLVSTPSPAVRMTETAEQVLREMAGSRRAFELHDVSLINLPTGPIVAVTASGSRPPVAAQIKFAEDKIRERLGDPAASLLVRATTTSNVTAKGRILLGAAHFVPLTAADQDLQAALEARGKTELERLADTFVNAIDAAPGTDGWEVRAEIVSPRAPQPADVARVEAALAAAAAKPVSLSVLTPDGLIIRGAGYTTVQRAIEEDFARQIATRAPAGDAPPAKP